MDLALQQPLMKRHYTKPIQCNSLKESIDLAKVLGSISIDVDNTTEREVKYACEVCRRTEGVVLCAWGEGEGLNYILEWMKQFNETYVSSIKFSMFINPKVRTGPHIKRDLSRSGWCLTGVLNDIKMLTCIIDSVPNWGLMQETFNRACQIADTLGIAYIVPWLSLGYGRKPDGVNEITDVVEWDYLTSLDEWVGWEMNHRHCSEQYPRYPRWNRSPFIVIERFNLEEHFFSYLRGAMRI